MKLLSTLVILTFSALTAHASSPRVVTSIAPIQGLVAEIMSGVATPTLLLDEPISPHDFAMRPSQANAISGADVVFYVGGSLEPWLTKALISRGQNGLAIALGDLPALHHLPARDLQDFGEGTEDHDDHGHEADDPHMWLNPENVLIWLDIIAGTLEIVDPDNQEIYRANLERLRAEIAETVYTMRRQLTTLSAIEMIVTHDSTQYFEEAFHLNVIGAFSASDGQTAGARNLNSLLRTFNEDTCIVEDITHPAKITNSLPDYITHVKIDPMGYDALGRGYYSNLLNNITQSLMECLD